jgi:thioredoxin-like negative regulator of GroEL
MRPLPVAQHDAVLSTGLAVLVFRTSKSPACMVFQPELDQLVARRPHLSVWTVEAAQQRVTSERHEVRALPTTVIYRDGLPARRIVGGLSADQLDAAVKEVAEADMEAEISGWMRDMVQIGEPRSPYLQAG